MRLFRIFKQAVCFAFIIVFLSGEFLMSGSKTTTTTAKPATTTVKPTTTTTTAKQTTTTTTAKPTTTTAKSIATTTTAVSATNTANVNVASPIVSNTSTATTVTKDTQSTTEINTPIYAQSNSADRIALFNIEEPYKQAVGTVNAVVKALSQSSSVATTSTLAVDAVLGEEKFGVAGALKIASGKSGISGTTTVLTGTFKEGAFGDLKVTEGSRFKFIRNTDGVFGTIEIGSFNASNDRQVQVGVINPSNDRTLSITGPVVYIKKGASDSDFTYAMKGTGTVKMDEVYLAKLPSIDIYSLFDAKNSMFVRYFGKCPKDTKLDITGLFSMFTFGLLKEEITSPIFSLCKVLDAQSWNAYKAGICGRDGDTNKAVCKDASGVAITSGGEAKLYSVMYPGGLDNKFSLSVSDDITIDISNVVFSKQFRGGDEMRLSCTVNDTIDATIFGDNLFSILGFLKAKKAGNGGMKDLLGSQRAIGLQLAVSKPALAKLLGKDPTDMVPVSNLPLSNLSLFFVYAPDTPESNGKPAVSNKGLHFTQSNPEVDVYLPQGISILAQCGLDTPLLKPVVDLFGINPKQPDYAALTTILSIGIKPLSVGIQILLPITTDIGDFTLNGIALGLSANSAGKIVVGFDAFGTAVLSGSTSATAFDIQAQLSTPPPSVKLMGTMIGQWNNPFGVSGLTVNAAALEIGTTIPPTPATVTVGLAADLTISDKMFKIAAKYSPEGDIVGYLKFAGSLSTNDLLEFAKIPKAVRNILPEIIVTDPEIKIAPRDTSIGIIPFYQGLTLTGSVSMGNLAPFMGKLLGNDNPTAYVNVVANISNGIRAQGVLPEFDILGLGLWKLSGNGLPGTHMKGPAVSLMLTNSEQSFYFSGSVKSLLDETAAEIHIDSSGFSIELTQKFLDGVIEIDIVGESVTDAKGDFDDVVFKGSISQKDGDDLGFLGDAIGSVMSVVNPFQIQELSVGYKYKDLIKGKAPAFTFDINAFGIDLDPVVIQLNVTKPYQLFVDVAEVIVKNIGTLLSKGILKGVNAVVDSVGNVVNNVVNTVVRDVSDQVDALRSNFNEGDYLDALGNVGAVAALGAVSVGKVFVSESTELISDVATASYDRAARIASKIKSGNVVDLFNGAVDSVGSGAGAIKSGAKMIVDLGIGKAKEAFSQVSTFAGSSVDSISNFASDVADKVSSTVRSVTDFVGITEEEPKQDPNQVAAIIKANTIAQKASRLIDAVVNNKLSDVQELVKEANTDFNALVVNVKKKLDIAIADKKIFDIPSIAKELENLNVASTMNINTYGPIGYPSKPDPVVPAIMMSNPVGDSFAKDLIAKAMSPQVALGYNTPLHLAVQANNVPIVNELLKSNVMSYDLVMGTSNKQGKNAFDLAMSGNMLSMYKVFFDAKDSKGNQKFNQGFASPQFKKLYQQSFLNYDQSLISFLKQYPMFDFNALDVSGKTNALDFCITASVNAAQRRNLDSSLAYLFKQNYVDINKYWYQFCMDNDNNPVYYMYCKSTLPQDVVDTTMSTPSLVEQLCSSALYSRQKTADGKSYEVKKSITKQACGTYLFGALSRALSDYSAANGDQKKVARQVYMIDAILKTFSALKGDDKNPLVLPWSKLLLYVIMNNKADFLQVVAANAKNEFAVRANKDGYEMTIRDLIRSQDFDKNSTATTLLYSLGIASPTDSNEKTIPVWSSDDPRRFLAYRAQDIFQGVSFGTTQKQVTLNKKKADDALRTRTIKPTDTTLNYNVPVRFALEGDPRSSLWMSPFSRKTDISGNADPLSGMDHYSIFGCGTQYFFTPVIGDCGLFVLRNKLNPNKIGPVKFGDEFEIYALSTKGAIVPNAVNKSDLPSNYVPWSSGIGRMFDSQRGSLARKLFVSPTSKYNDPTYAEIFVGNVATPYIGNQASVFTLEYAPSAFMTGPVLDADTVKIKSKIGRVDADSPFGINTYVQMVAQDIPGKTISGITDVVVTSTRSQKGLWKNSSFVVKQDGDLLDVSTSSLIRDCVISSASAIDAKYATVASNKPYVAGGYLFVPLAPCKNVSGLGISGSYMVPKFQATVTLLDGTTKKDITLATNGVYDRFSPYVVDTLTGVGSYYKDSNKGESLYIRIGVNADGNLFYRMAVASLLPPVPTTTTAATTTTTARSTGIASIVSAKLSDTWDVTPVLTGATPSLLVNGSIQFSGANLFDFVLNNIGYDASGVASAIDVKRFKANPTLLIIAKRYDGLIIQKTLKQEDPANMNFVWDGVTYDVVGMPTTTTTTIAPSTTTTAFQSIITGYQIKVPFTIDSTFTLSNKIPYVAQGFLFIPLSFGIGGYAGICNIPAGAVTVTLSNGTTQDIKLDPLNRYDNAYKRNSSSGPVPYMANDKAWLYLRLGIDATGKTEYVMMPESQIPYSPTMTTVFPTTTTTTVNPIGQIDSLVSAQLSVDGANYDVTSAIALILQNGKIIPGQPIVYYATKGARANYNASSVSLLLIVKRKDGLVVAKTIQKRSSDDTENFVWDGVAYDILASEITTTTTLPTTVASQGIVSIDSATLTSNNKNFNVAWYVRQFLINRSLVPKQPILLYLSQQLAGSGVNYLSGPVLVINATRTDGVPVSKTITKDSADNTNEFVWNGFSPQDPVMQQPTTTTTALPTTIIETTTTTVEPTTTTVSRGVVSQIKEATLNYTEWERRRAAGTPDWMNLYANYPVPKSIVAPVGIYSLALDGKVSIGSFDTAVYSNGSVTITALVQNGAVMQSPALSPNSVWDGSTGTVISQPPTTTTITTTTAIPTTTTIATTTTAEPTTTTAAIISTTVAEQVQKVVNYNSVIEITALNDAKLWTFPFSKVWGAVINAGNPDVSTNKDMYEVLVGAPAEDARLTTGPQYFMLRAADGSGREGAIQYGDMIEVYALSTKNTSGVGWSGMHNADFTDLSRKLFVNNGAYWGPGWGQVLVGRVNNPLILGSASQFTLQSASGATGSVKLGDKIKLVLAATGKIVWAFGGSLYGSAYGTLLVGDTLVPNRSQGEAGIFTIVAPVNRPGTTSTEISRVSK